MPPKKTSTGLKSLVGKMIKMESVYDQIPIEGKLLSVDNEYFEIELQGKPVFISKHVIRLVCAVSEAT